MITRDWTGLRREVAAGVGDALGQTVSNEALWRLELENQKTIDALEKRLGGTVENEDVRDLLSRMNLHLIFSGSIIMEREDAVRIIEVLYNQDQEIQRLRKIVGAIQGAVGAAADADPVFAGVPVDEAIDRVLGYAEAMKYIPHTCKTCRYQSGRGGEMDYEHSADERAVFGDSWCDHTEDHKCRWEFRGKWPENNCCSKCRGDTLYG